MIISNYMNYISEKELDSFVYSIKREVDKLKKLYKIENVTKENFYKQTEEIKWEIYKLESYIKIKKQRSEKDVKN